MLKCDRCGRESETTAVREYGPRDPQTGYRDQEIVCGDCIREDGRPRVCLQCEADITDLESDLDICLDCQASESKYDHGDQMFTSKFEEEN